MKLRAITLLLFAFVFTDAKQRSVAPSAVYDKARLAMWQGDYDRALSLARDGRALTAQPEWRELFSIIEAEVLGRRAPKDALALLDRIPPSANREAAVRRLIARAYALSNANRQQEAEGAYARADAVAKRLKPELRPEVALNRITPAFRQNDYTRAEQLADEAMAGARAQQQPFVLVNAIVMLGTIEMNREQWERAQQHFAEGAPLARAIGAHFTESVIIGNVGWCYQQLGDLDEAKDRFAEAEAYAEAHDVLRVQPTWLANIANVYVARRQFAEALPFAERSVAAARKLNDRQKLATSLSNLAQVHIELGRLDSAARTNAESLAIRRTTGDERNVPYSLLNQARIDAATGAPARALTTLDQVIARADHPPLRWQAQAIAASIDSRLGRTADAAKMYEAALETGDSARAGVKETDAYLFAFESNLIRFYDDYIDLLLRSGRTIDALRVAERSRARTLREGIGLLERGTTGRRALTPTALAKAHGASILSYWLAPQRSLLWVVAAGGVSVVELPPKATIEGAMSAYRRELLDGRRSTDSVRGARLYEMLVPPTAVSASARTSRIIVIPDGRMSAINLESLIVSPTATWKRHTIR